MDENKKIKKPTWYVIFIAAVCFIALIIASAVIYSTFFEKNINKEKNRQIAEDYMTDKLESNSKEAAVYREENKKIIEKYSLDIFGTYTCTFNELTGNKDNPAETKPVTYVMELKDDSTALFADGTKGWWMLKEAQGGLIHMGLVLPEEETPQIYLVCKDKLIDETKACFIGEIPESNYFEASFTSGGFTLDFAADGSVDGEYREMVKDGDTEYPHAEAYSGEYRRNGDILDIVLNGAPARYMIFETSTGAEGKQVSGFATRYYIKSTN